MPRARAEFERLWIWERVGERLPWYFAVATNKRPAKYLLARRVPVEASLGDASTEALWQEHERATQRFLALWRGVREGKRRLRELEPASPSLMDLSVELAKRMLRRCTFCRWRCKVDRGADGKRGTCQLAAGSRVGGFFHHRGEELVFRGTGGSGTIFFTSCNLRCGFCQNGDISHDKDNGVEFTPRDLALAAWQLRMEGCHNANWVGGEPTIHLHNIVEAISLLGWFEPSGEDLERVARAKADRWQSFPRSRANADHEGEFNVPVLWNSNFFMSEETTRLLRCLVDVWLPDFKFGSDKCSVRLARTPWYWDTVTRNHKLVHDWGEDMVVRHLVMPNHVACCTRPVLDWLAAHVPRALVNVMDQFHPDCACDPSGEQFDPKLEDIARYPTAAEIKESYAHAERLGLAWRELSLEKHGYRG